MSLDKELVRFRKKMMMNRSEFAALLNLHRQTVYTWEHGLAKPSYAVIRKIMKVAKRFGLREDADKIISHLIDDED